MEKELREYLDVPELSLMVNGHMSLEMAIQMMGFPEGAEVITTPFTFISTTHAIVRNGLKPIFCDIKLSDGTIDETKIEDLITEHTVAIVPVHVYGNICNVEAIQRIADKYDLRVIYDAAHENSIKKRGLGVMVMRQYSVFMRQKCIIPLKEGQLPFRNIAITRSCIISRILAYAMKILWQE